MCVYAGRLIDLLTPNNPNNSLNNPNDSSNTSTMRLDDDLFGGAVSSDPEDKGLQPNNHLNHPNDLEEEVDDGLLIGSEEGSENIYMGSETNNNTTTEEFETVMEFDNDIHHSNIPSKPTDPNSPISSTWLRLDCYEEMGHGECGLLDRNKTLTQLEIQHGMLTNPRITLEYPGITVIKPSTVR